MAENFKSPYRIIVIGSSCAGRTTLAKNSAKALNIRHVELDAIHWKANWVEREDEEFREMIETRLSENTYSFKVVKCQTSQSIFLFVAPYQYQMQPFFV